MTHTCDQWNLTAICAHLNQWEQSEENLEEYVQKQRERPDGLIWKTEIGALVWKCDTASPYFGFWMVLEESE